MFILFAGKVQDGITATNIYFKLVSVDQKTVCILQNVQVSVNIF